MLDCVVLIRLSSGNVDYLSDDDGNMTIFPDRDVAIDAALKSKLCQIRPHQVVELDEL